MWRCQGLKVCSSPPLNFKPRKKNEMTVVKMDPKSRTTIDKTPAEAPTEAPTAVPVGMPAEAPTAMPEEATKPVGLPVGISIQACEKCGGTVFTEGIVLYRISKLNPNNTSGKDQLTPQTGFYCPKCFTFLPIQQQ